MWKVFGIFVNFFLSLPHEMLSLREKREENLSLMEKSLPSI